MDRSSGKCYVNFFLNQQMRFIIFLIQQKSGARQGSVDSCKNLWMKERFVLLYEKKIIGRKYERNDCLFVFNHNFSAAIHFSVP